MALQTSGQISLNDIHVEAGGTSGTQASLNDSDIRNLIDKSSGAQNSFSEYYGASAATDLPTSGSQINGQAQLKQITVSDYISSGGTLNVPSNLWVWSDSRTTAAMIVDIPCTINNSGKIIGKGGRGAYRLPTSGGNFNAETGGPAISVTSTGVTIVNNSGAYIAGGGGGGGARYDGGNPTDSNAGGGGGAGGGQGGNARNDGFLGGAGGSLNSSGADATRASDGVVFKGAGGGAGGAGGSFGYGGGGGGRILPGVGGKNGGYHATGSVLSGGFELCEGGSAGNVGHGPNPVGYSYSDLAAGGGGWGASGGNGSVLNGASGGAAITGTSRTLSNSGTIYGST